jgi:hypothetical protein
MPNTLTYGYPESQLLGGHLSVQCDVRALGYVCLGFLCWFFNDYDAVERFRKSREYEHETNSFYFIDRNEHQTTRRAELKDSVIVVS